MLTFQITLHSDDSNLPLCVSLALLHVALLQNLLLHFSHNMVVYFLLIDLSSHHFVRIFELSLTLSAQSFLGNNRSPLFVFFLLHVLFFICACDTSSGVFCAPSNLTFLSSFFFNEIFPSFFLTSSQPHHLIILLPHLDRFRFGAIQSLVQARPLESKLRLIRGIFLVPMLRTEDNVFQITS